MTSADTLPTYAPGALIRVRDARTGGTTWARVRRAQERDGRWTLVVDVYGTEHVLAVPTRADRPRWTVVP